MASQIKVDTITNAAGTGGVLLKGVIDASAATAGYVGELMSATAGTGLHGATILADTWTDASSMGTITLTAGSWLLGYHVSVSLRSNSGTNQIFGNVAIYETTNQIAGTVCALAADSVASPVRSVFSASRMTVVDISTSKTYKMQTRNSVATAVADTFIEGNDTLSGSLTNPDNSSVLWAVRIR